MAPVERAHELLQLVEVGRLDVAVERLAPQDRLERGIAMVAREQRAAEALERVLLILRVVRASGNERERQRNAVERAAAFQLEDPFLAIEIRELAGAFARRRIDRVA